MLYYVVDYNRFWRYKGSFGKFKDAYTIQQLIAPEADIECWDGEKREVVWSHSWEIATPAMLERYTTLLQ